VERTQSRQKDDIYQIMIVKLVAKNEYLGVWKLLVFTYWHNLLHCLQLWLKFNSHTQRYTTKVFIPFIPVLSEYRLLQSLILCKNTKGKLIFYSNFASRIPQVNISNNLRDKVISSMLHSTLLFSMQFR